ncbi:MAG: hypothetical protein AAGI17_11315 [Planctomycetota bacterium]
MKINGRRIPLTKTLILLTIGATSSLALAWVFALDPHSLFGLSGSYPRWFRRIHEPGEPDTIIGRSESNLAMTRYSLIEFIETPESGPDERSMVIMRDYYTPSGGTFRTYTYPPSNKNTPLAIRPRNIPRPRDLPKRLGGETNRNSDVPVWIIGDSYGFPMRVLSRFEEGNLSTTRTTGLIQRDSISSPFGFRTGLLKPNSTRLPTRILWPGLIVNTFITAAALWLGLAGITAVRRHRRRATGRCPGCGYDLVDLTTCPECGETNHSKS